MSDFNNGGSGLHEPPSAHYLDWVNGVDGIKCLEAMQTLNWKVREAVVNYHLTVPFRLLKYHHKLASSEPVTGNDARIHIMTQGSDYQGSIGDPNPQS